MASKTSSLPLLLVDGYNIVGAWPKLTAIRDSGDLAGARRELVEALINYAAEQDYQTLIVFDAYYQDTPGKTEAETPLLSVHYTAPAQTADTYIEKTCARLGGGRSPRPRRLIVATSDQAQRNTVLGYGAEWRSAQQLITDLGTSRHQARRRFRTTKRSPGRFLGSALNAQAKAHLSQWRLGKP